MQTVTLENMTRPLQQPLQAGYCISFTCQLRGLMFRRTLPPNWGLLLVQHKESKIDAAIHMFMMWMDLAVIWINARNQVVDVQPAYRWKSIIVPAAPAKYVLEAPLDYLKDFQIGDEIKISTPDSP
jgi:uncharacterized membrane protein (UPF0127 family)